MRTVELTNEQIEAVEPEYLCADWKASIDHVLGLIDEQLWEFDLEIVQADTGSDEYWWKIEKRQK